MQVIFLIDLVQILDFLSTLVLLFQVVHVALNLLLSLLDAILNFPGLLFCVLFLHALDLGEALLRRDLVWIETLSPDMLLYFRSLCLHFLHLVQVADQAFLLRLLLLFSLAHGLFLNLLSSSTRLLHYVLELFLLFVDLLTKDVLSFKQVGNDALLVFPFALRRFIAPLRHKISVPLVPLELLLELRSVFSLLLGRQLNSLLLLELGIL